MEPRIGGNAGLLEQSSCRQGIGGLGTGLPWPAAPYISNSWRGETFRLELADVGSGWLEKWVMQKKNGPPCQEDYNTGRFRQRGVSRLKDEKEGNIAPQTRTARL